MKFNLKTLENGLRILTIPMKDNETVTAMVLVETGSNYEQKKQGGISHFLEHVCFKGTVNRPSSEVINYEFDSIGSQSNAFTSNEYTGYYAKAHYAHLPKILDLISDIYLNSTFPEAEIQKEKGVVIEEINMYEDRPDQKVGELFDELLYGDQPAGRSILGTKETVRALTRDNIVEYKNKHYIAAKTLIVISGKFDEGTIDVEIEKYFASIPVGQKQEKALVVESQTSPAMLLHSKNADQTHFILGWRSFDAHDKRLTALSLLSTILGKGMSSRLFHKMREELGICYYIYASQLPKTDHGTFTISAGVSNDRVEEAIAAILEEIKKIKAEKVGEKELRKAKDFRIGNLSLALESSDSYADFYGFQEIMGEKIMTPKERIESIEQVTAEDIQSVANEIFVNETMNLAVVGPYSDEQKIKELLSL